MNYRKTDAIQWYKEESCIYRELNAALRSTCLNRILAYRFFIRDLSLQLKEEQNNLLNINDENVIYLYSGKRTSDIEIDRLKNLKSGCLISIDSFLSTSRNESVANNFMKGSDKPGKPLIPIRYDLKCNLRLKTKPYADISAERFGAFSGEEEVLFMVGTIFKFKQMFYDNKLNCWRVKLELIDENNHQLSQLYQSIRDEMGEETDLLTLGGLLVNAGDYEHALRIYVRSFFDNYSFDGIINENQQLYLTKSLIGIASVQCSLGRYDFSIQIFDQIIKNINNINNIDLQRYYKAIAYYEKSQPLLEKGKNFDALKQCQHALSIFTKYHGEMDSLTANCYEMIGNIYGNLGRLEKTKHNINGQYLFFEKAFHYYNKTLNIRKIIYEKSPDHYVINVTYLNIGELFRDMGKPDEALKYTLKAYKSFLKAFPKAHNWIGIALDNIGEIYVLQQRFNQAKQKYDQAIDIFKQTLPSDHRSIGETLHNIGKLYCCTYVFDKALDYFNQAKIIYQKKIPPNHYLAVELNEQINYVTNQLYGLTN
jgi:tetratricopeptide (TPR) repeat protein